MTEPTTNDRNGDDHDVRLERIESRLLRIERRLGMAIEPPHRAAAPRQVTLTSFRPAPAVPPPLPPPPPPAPMPAERYAQFVRERDQIRNRLDQAPRAPLTEEALAAEP